MNAATPLDSVMGTIFSMGLKGQLPKDEHDSAMACYVEKHPYEYPIRLFPEVPLAAREYVARRLRGGEFEQRSAVILGDYFRRCLEVASENDANLSLLRWARELLVAKNLPTPRIDTALANARAINNYTQFIWDALEVKRRDANRPRGRE